MTLGSGFHRPNIHRKHKLNLAPQQRSDAERAIQHSALVRAKGQTLKASIVRRDDTRFLAVRPDLFDTPIPGLGGGSADGLIFPPGEPLSPTTREAMFSPPMPALNHDLQPSHCMHSVSMAPSSPSPSTTSQPSRYERRRSGFSAGGTPRTLASVPPSHSSASDRHGRALLSPASQPLPPSPLDLHVDQMRREMGGGRFHIPFHIPAAANGRHPHTGPSLHSSSLLQGQHDTTELTTGHRSTSKEGERPSLPRGYQAFTQSASPLNQTTSHQRPLSQRRSPSGNPHNKMGTAQASQHPPSTSTHTGDGQAARTAQSHQDLGSSSGCFDIPDVLDLEMEDSFLGAENDGAAHGKDPYHRLSTLESQVELQSKKLDSTNTKLDLLCDLIQHLKGSESGSGGGNPSTPRQGPPPPTNSSGGSTSQDPAPALLVLGSRSNSQANHPQLPAQPNVLSRRRTRAELQIERAIDAHWKTLMSTYQLPERGVVKGYKLENGKACSATTFQPDHRENVKSPWNTSVVEVFIDSLFSSNHPHIPTPPAPEMRATVLRLAFSQLRSWREKQRLTAEEEKAKLRKKRRYERRRQSYFRRVNVASLYTDTRRHLEMLSYLGPDGMSSDESDHEEANGIAQYRIRHKSWRHPHLVRCLRVLDALHRKDRFHEDDDDDRAANTADAVHPIRLTAGPGAPTHLRMEGGSNSTRKPKKGLPDCLYNPDLLKRPEGERLQAIRSEPYDFSHSADIIRMARSKNGDASSLGPFPEM